MKIAHEFTVSAPVERAWAVQTDLEGIVPYAGGALTRRLEPVAIGVSVVVAVLAYLLARG